jgi:hypothetical protein
MPQDPADRTLEQDRTRSRLRDRALVVGGGLWLLAVGICMYLNDQRVTAVLMPLWMPITWLAGPGFNIGTPDKPLYEATPVQALAGLAGIGLSALIYVSLTYVLLRWRQHRSSGQPRA